MANCIYTGGEPTTLTDSVKSAEKAKKLKGNSNAMKCDLPLDSNLIVRLPAVLKAQFAERARAEGVTLSDLVWTLLEERCEQPLPKKSSPSA